MDYQLILYFQEYQYLKIFVFRVSWKINCQDAGIQLIGLKYLIAKQGIRWNYATPLMNQSSRINGIQITYQVDKGSDDDFKFINLENFKNEDW